MARTKRAERMERRSEDRGALEAYRKQWEQRLQAKEAAWQSREAPSEED